MDLCLWIHNGSGTRVERRELRLKTSQAARGAIPPRPRRRREAGGTIHLSGLDQISADMRAASEGFQSQFWISLQSNSIAWAGRFTSLEVPLLPSDRSGRSAMYTGRENSAISNRTEPWSMANPQTRLGFGSGLDAISCSGVCHNSWSL